ncbi:hypothetical protein GLYMA_10G262000v4 [Glycine max]|nr:hypothetical protein GLYMA_10G262000v4 [Glycine max]
MLLLLFFFSSLLIYAEICEWQCCAWRNETSKTTDR